MEDFEKILDRTEEMLGLDRARRLHMHFSTIEFTKVAEARDYRESMAKRTKADATSDGNTSAFPTSLFS